jgi:ABC-type multidrug transport system fused ATPase/permease subunit
MTPREQGSTCLFHPQRLTHPIRCRLQICCPHAIALVILRADSTGTVSVDDHTPPFAVVLTVNSLIAFNSILNLFSRDIFVVDEVLVRVFSGFFRTFASILGVMGVVAFGAPIVLLAVIPMGFIYRIIMRYYLNTSRELKRLDAVSRSPVFAWFGETLSGVSTIRVSRGGSCLLGLGSLTRLSSSLD